MIDYPNVTDYSSAEPRQYIECDVLIIGTGAGGGIAAEVMAKAGFKVLMVEEGPLKTSKDFKMLEKEAYAELYQEVAGRQTLDQSIQILQGRAVGGSTTVNWTSSFRTPVETLNYWQKNFKFKSITPETLEPWFDWAEKRLNIAPWALPPNLNNQLLANGAKALGWDSQVIPRNVSGCANLGYCGTGCPINAKQSMLVTCIPEALRNSAELICRARVEELVVNGGKIEGAWLSAIDNFGQVKSPKVSRVVAKHTILSAGAIGSPAILLRSQMNKPLPSIGKRTFLHPVTASIAEMSQPVKGYQGAPQSIYSDQFLWRDGVSGELGYKLEVPPLHPVIAATLLRKHGEAHFQLMERFESLQANLALMRDGFKEESQGGNVILDKYFYPHLDYPLTDTMWRGLKHAMYSMVEIQFAAGAKEVMPMHMDASFINSWQQAKADIEKLPMKKLRWQLMSAHVMGGCGISGDDDLTGVCEENGKIKGFDGVSVMDGSLFPTSLGVNPQLSIYALVAKLAVELAIELGGQVGREYPSSTTIQTSMQH